MGASILEVPLVDDRATISELTGGGLIAKTVVRIGDPAQQIVEQARADATDLIVMRTHGRAGLTRAVLGSVAERVLALTPVPLLLLRPGGHYVSQMKSVMRKRK